MGAPGPKVPDALCQALELGLASPKQVSFSNRQDQVLRRILACGTGRLGSHYLRCDDCGHWEAFPKSCRDRHCPRCQKRQSHLWLLSQERALLPVAYYHVVFTLPHALNPVIRQNPKLCLDLLFDAACSTVMDFGRNNLGARLGITAVLHTWGQSLCEHYHLHLIIPGGGLSESEDEWLPVSEGKKGERWLFAVRALSKVYLARYLEGLGKLYQAGELVFFGDISQLANVDAWEKQLHKWARQKWVVYSKAPFAGPEKILAYLARYTHRVAISPKRVLRVDTEHGKVVFAYKNYAAGGKWNSMELDAAEFTRRFAQHILPPGFSKIRHYGLLGTRTRHEKIPLCRQLLGLDGQWTPRWEQTQKILDAKNSASLLAGQQPAPQSKDGLMRCPCCGSTRLRWLTSELHHLGSRLTRAPPPP